MYRCFVCESPAQMQCACVMRLQAFPHPLHSTPKINIASGEDAMQFEEPQGVHLRNQETNRAVAFSL